ncbi:MAG: DNA cytosine methyltransferase, partial [Peptostreptococcaceae bacterium]
PQRRSRVFMVSKLGSKLGLKKENMNLSECSNSLNFLCDHNLNKNGKYQTEFDAAQLNNTPSREYMWKINAKILNESTIVNTITCNMDRSNTSAMFEYCGIKGSTYRLLTIREAFKLMGFTDIDYENAKKANLSYRKMNKLIGNSIVVKVLEEIFKGMFGGI